MSGKKVVIIGAGIAGLSASRGLLKSGYDVTILEARDRCGGRILTLHAEDYFVEAGPEFIHGRLAATLALLKAYGIGYAETSGQSYRLAQGRLVGSDEEPEGWEEMLERMGKVAADTTLADFLRVQYPGEEWAPLRARAEGFASGFDLADPEKVSARSLAKEWQTESGPQFRLLAGYGQLISSLENEVRTMGGHILLNTPLEKVEWAKQSFTCYSGGAKVVEGQFGLYTIPVAVIQGNPHAEQWLPRLPQKIQAADQIGVGTVIKLVMEWTEPFWASAGPEALFFFGDTSIPTWWTNRPLSGNQLTGWLGGPAALSWTGTEKEKILTLALESLAAFSGLPTGKLKSLLKAFYIFDWTADPLAGGAYSYTLASAPEARQIWAAPVDDTLYFAGEACHNGTMIGTVEAAVLSAEAAVSKILADHGSH